MTHTHEEIRKLVDAGEKATQGEFDYEETPRGYELHVFNEIYRDGIKFANCEKFIISGANAEFIRKAANARPALKQLLSELDTKDKEIERLRKLLSQVSGRADVISHEYLNDQIEQALKGGQDDE